MTTLIIIATGIIVAIFLSVVILWTQSRSARKQPFQHPTTANSIDSWNIPAHFSQEEQAKIKEIADFYGVRYVTDVETRKWILHKLSEDFAAMPGWDMWDSSIHEASGQFERAERGSSHTSISVLCYSAKYKIAKIRGETGIYLTSYKRCSCPDFRKRRLPCKHMYALAIELDGDVNKDIFSREYGPLYGLTFALAGRFAGGRTGDNGIRTRISDLGGEWTDNILQNSTALITGTSPSESKLDIAKSLDMEILPVECIDDLFPRDKDNA